MKKALSLFLALCMVFTTFPVWVMAQEVDTITGLSEEIIGFSGGKIQSTTNSPGIRIDSGATALTIKDCTISGNTSGIAFENPSGFQSLDIIASTVTGQQGIYYSSNCNYKPVGAINIKNSQIIGNGTFYNHYGIHLNYAMTDGIHIDGGTIFGVSRAVYCQIGSTNNIITVSGPALLKATNNSAIISVKLQMNGVKVVKASMNSDGSLPDNPYDASKLTSYKYLEFAPKDTYTITYNANGGDGTMEAGTAIEEEAFPLPENGFTPPEGKRFQAWAIGSTSGTQVSAGGSYTFTADTTVYAIWEDITYTITYNANGGTGSMTNGTATYGKPFTLPANGFTPPAGKRLKAWAIGSTFGTQVSAGDSYTFTADTTVYAIWEDITYTITYNANGGGGSMTDGTATHGKPFTLPENGFTPPAGKRFKAWALGGTSGTQRSAGGSYTFTADTTAYAIWEDITYTIAFDANGGTGSMTAGTAREGESFQLPANGFTPPAGMRFVAWAIGDPSGTQVSASGSHTFTANTTVYAVWEDIPTYTITCDANGGEGTMATGTAREGESFQLPANGFTPPAGKRFVAWAIGSPSGPQMSAGSWYLFSANTTVYAVWEHITYTITATAGAGGSISPSGGVTVNSGDSRTFTITPNSNYSIADVKVDDVSQGKITSYTFDNVTADHTISVTFNHNGGSSSGRSSDDDDSSSGGSSGSSSNAAPLVVADQPNAPTQGETTVSGTVDASGNLTVNVTNQAVTNALDQALAEARKNGTAENGVTVVIQAGTSGNWAGTAAGSRVTVNLPKAVQETIIAKQIINTVIVVNNPDIRVGLDLTAVREINQQAKSDVHITATRRSSERLTGDARNAIGNRPTFDLTVNYGSGKQVQSFGSGTVAIAIPYTLGATETAGNLMAVYVDDNGKVHWLTNSVYDSEAKVLRFTTNHFSTYGVGYKQGNAFTDLGTHWAKDDIEFAVSRGLLGGTTATTFGPNAALTRGALVTALGRLANVDVSGYAKSSFADVKQGAYYLGYAEWAAKKNILEGSNGKFAPDQAITREQLAVILHSYAKATGFTLPKVQVENTFADSSKISVSAKDAVKQVQMAGILSSKQSNRFDPKGTVTRAEFAAVLRRLVERKISGDAMQGWVRNDAGQWVYCQDGKPVTGKKVVDGQTYAFDQHGVTADEPKKRKAGTYAVQQGDSFWLIAYKVGCTISDLEHLNRKSRNDMLHPGDVLQIPQK
ncbi:MAG: InlB B-repeat-containing protein [Oscillospiraceae bacterium]